ncbi:hypothetical protein [Maribacter sp. 4G9]|uniref:hypothetical protein n=1 Tax=Maribacter sp. 4G9 TaxID=1889777 RepID=UPI000C15654C|nr:hypothetical protein [Maribacter sp. 4G9]PIB26256.1 hypothetical protein BFP75_08430 [Maribacter sp. 4G9]
MFYKLKPKENLDLRNKLFLEKGIVALKKQGFEKSPFNTDWYGRTNHNDFSYTMYRLKKENELQKIETHILRNENWIQIRLNIFKIRPEINSLEELKESDGLKFHLPPNSLTEMRLRSDTYDCMPLFYMLFLPEHKIGRYFTKNGFNKRLKELSELVLKDMRNIDFYIAKWKEKYKPKTVNWKSDTNEKIKNTAHNTV